MFSLYAPARLSAWGFHYFHGLKMKPLKSIVLLLYSVACAVPVKAADNEQVMPIEPQSSKVDHIAIGQEKAEQYGSDEPPWWSLKLAYSPWFVNWRQISTAATRFGSEAINVDYTIDGAIAQSARIEFNLFDLGAELNLVEIPKETAGEGQTLSFLSLGLNYANFFGSTELQYRFEKGSFTGFIDGAGNGGNAGNGAFETDVVSHDITLLTSWGVGIGYRSFAYELPQDVYLINTNTQVLLHAGFVDMNYDADFYTLFFARDELLKPDAANFNLGLQFRYGIGRMVPSGEFLADTKQALRDGNLDDDIIEDADASVLELDFYAYMPLFPSERITNEIRFGYRSNTMTASFSEGGGDYALVSDFETQFSGPYVAITADF